VVTEKGRPHRHRAGLTVPQAPHGQQHGYNHYPLLRTIENTFGLAPLGYAETARGFGHDVWGTGRAGR
jgi:hypothetical protein